MNPTEVLSLLKSRSDPKRAEIVKKYMKSSLKFVGVANPECRKIAKMIYKKDRNTVPYEIIEKLWKTGNFEAMYIALYLLECYKKKYDNKAWNYVNKMVENVENWGHCDQLCNLRGEFWERNDFLKTMSKWSRSKNLWKRRSAAVSLLARRPLRIPFSFDDAMKVLEPIMYDKEYYVQKGVGWMLRVLYQQYPKEVFSYLIKHKDIPRVALRTACEKMGDLEKEQVMKQWAK